MAEYKSKKYTKPGEQKAIASGKALPLQDNRMKPAAAVAQRKAQTVVQLVKTGEATFDAAINNDAAPEVKAFVNKLPSGALNDLVAKSKDNPSAFRAAIASLDTFSGQHGWYSFTSKIPNKAMASHRVKEQAKKGKLMPTGGATDEELAEVHAFTQHGDMLNVPLRYQPGWMGPELKARHETLKKGMKSLSKAPGRSAAGKNVYSGKAYSLADFQAKISGNTGSKVPLSGMVSSTSNVATAEGFVKLTEKWAGAGTKVGVIFRIHSTAGVHIDDLSEWGHHMGPVRHGEEPPAIQVQNEVLMDEGEFIQTGAPVPYKMIGGMQYYFVDCKEPERTPTAPTSTTPASTTPAPSAPSVSSARVHRSSHGTMAAEGIRASIPASQESDRHKSSHTIDGKPRWKR